MSVETVGRREVRRLGRGRRNKRKERGGVGGRIGRTKMGRKIVREEG